MRRPRPIIPVFLIVTMILSSALHAADWRRNFLGANNDLWRKRIPIMVQNTSEQAVQGLPIVLKIGINTDEIPLAGMEVSATRVSDSAGRELLFQYTDAQGKTLIRGPVPSDGTLVIPVTLKPGQQEIYHVYVDNPSALPAAEFLKVDAKSRQSLTSAIIRSVGPIETIPVNRQVAQPTWPVPFSDNPLAVAVPLYVGNLDDKPLERVLTTCSIARFAARGINQQSIAIYDGTTLIKHVLAGDNLFFECQVPPHTLKLYYLYYFATPMSRATTLEELERLAPIPAVTRNASDQIGDIPSNQVYRDAAFSVLTPGLAGIMNSSLNLVKDPSFENTSSAAGGWTHGAEGILPPGTTLEIVEDQALDGKRSAHMFIPPASKKTWIGWRQTVPVGASQSYMIAAWVKTQDLNGSLTGYLHLFNASNQVVDMQTFGSPVSGTTGWQLLCSTLNMPANANAVSMELTTEGKGNVWYDAAMIVKVTEALAGDPTQQKTNAGFCAWAVNPIVKLFPDMLPPAESDRHLQVSLAGNEKEPVQIAVRYDDQPGAVTAEVAVPAGINAPSIRVVGFVPVPAKSAYMHSDRPDWEQKRTNFDGNTDGWTGWWPDPLLPEKTLTLSRGKTGAFWITFSATAETKPGRYACIVRFRRDDRLLQELPLTLNVRRFSLPEKEHLQITYDLRLTDHWKSEAPSRQETQFRVAGIMHENRITPDRVPAQPDFKLRNGEVIADFAAYDKVAEWYFNQMNFQCSYTPSIFYGFGWGLPPQKILGVEPYVGKYPYAQSDRRQLNPEYKRIYQQCLRLFWDHLKSKGWDTRMVLYISDEPHFQNPAIVEQMKALCDIVHEVDKNIRIYSSTWSHCPEWDGYLDIWGIGHYGCFPEQTIARLRAAGTSFWYTTDGQMCIDTPYCGFERMMPYYCFKYDVSAYEFWGIGWMTLNPYQAGWHEFIRQSETVGRVDSVQYPNGDGYLVYPGNLGGYAAPVASIRLEQTREGAEDYEYLYMLRERLRKAKLLGRDVTRGEQLLSIANRFVTIPNAGGRFSTKFLPNPQIVPALRDLVGNEIEKLP